MCVIVALFHRPNSGWVILSGKLFKVVNQNAGVLLGLSGLNFTWDKSIWLVNHLLVLGSHGSCGIWSPCSRSDNPSLSSVPETSYDWLQLTDTKNWSPCTRSDSSSLSLSKELLSQNVFLLGAGLCLSAHIPIRCSINGPSQWPSRLLCSFFKAKLYFVCSQVHHHRATAAPVAGPVDPTCWAAPCCAYFGTCVCAICDIIQRGLSPWHHRAFHSKDIWWFPIQAFSPSQIG